MPKEFKKLLRLGKVLAARIILLKKITGMPKGHSPKVKDSIHSILISKIDSNFKSLPKPAFTNGIIVVHLKKKAEYGGMFFLNQSDQ